MSDQTIALVTGATTGIGLVTAKELARLGHHVVLGCRTQGKGEATVKTIVAEIPNASLSLFVADLSILSEVKAACTAFAAQHSKLDLLIQNAGIAGQKGLSFDGFELTFAANHLGHFLQFLYLEPLLAKSEAPRLVVVSSEAHRQAKGINFDVLKGRTATSTGLGEYAVSKLCNLLFVSEVSQRFPYLLAVGLHPGTVATDVWRSLPRPLQWLAKRFMLSTEDGAKTTLYCATAPTSDLERGGYYEKSRQARASRRTGDAALGAQLWAQSESWVAAFKP